MSENSLSVSIGDRFSNLTVISRETPVGEKPVKWKCLCDCGNYTVVTTDKLKSGNTKSCGCLKSKLISERTKTHGLSTSRLYAVWSGIKSRCYSQTCREYKFYGALGVTMSPEWKDDFMSFHDWAIENGYDENAPRGKCTIDRIDPFGNYEPDNCRWVDMETQSHNKRADHQSD